MSNVGWTDGVEFGSWDDVSTDAPEPVSGLIEGTITKAEPRKTAGGKPAINLEIKMTAHFGGDEINPPRRAFCNVLLEKNFRMKQLCEATEVDLPTSSHIDEAERLCGDLDGKDVYFRGSVREYKGRKSTNVDRFLTAAQVQEASEHAAAASDELPKRRN